MYEIQSMYKIQTLLNDYKIKWLQNKIQTLLNGSRVLTIQNFVEREVDLEIAYTKEILRRKLEIKT